MAVLFFSAKNVNHEQLLLQCSTCVSYHGLTQRLVIMNDISNRSTLLKPILITIWILHHGGRLSGVLPPFFARHSEGQDRSTCSSPYYIYMYASHHIPVSPSISFPALAPLPWPAPRRCPRCRAGLRPCLSLACLVRIPRAFRTFSSLPHPRSRW